MEQQHLIGKHILQVEVPSAKNAYKVQQQMSQMVWKKLQPALAKLFDQLVDEDTFVQLDTIEIDAGEIDIDTFSVDELVQRIVDTLEKTIKERIRSATINQLSKQKSAKRIKGFTALEKKLFTQSNEEDREALWQQYQEEYLNNANNDTVTVIDSTLPRRRYYFNTWLFWLERGALPSYTIPPKENWILQVLETLGLDTDTVTILQKTVAKTPVALYRLILQHSLEDLISIVELYTGHSQKKLRNVFKELRAICSHHSDILQPTITYRNAEIQLWREVLTTVIINRQKLDSAILTEQLFTYAKKKELIVVGKLKKVVQEQAKQQYLQLKEYAIANPEYFTVTVTNKEDKDERYTVEEAEVHDKPIEENNRSEQEQEVVSKDNKEDTADVTAIKKVEETLQKEKQQQSLEEVLEELAEVEELPSPQFFNSAGVVLLHPFLSSFFRKLNLLEGKEFKNKTAQSKAVLLIHFLATGIEQPQEYEMVLPKFLCNMPTNIPIDYTLQITDEEKEKANGLLQAAIEHWGALGTTSPDGLREGFLTRQGKLEQEQTGWKLYVEPKTLDILLDKLPWNLSIVKLPWMNDFLKVEWR